MSTDNLSSTDDGLIGAYIFDGKGGASQVDWSAIHNWQPEQGVLWVHLDYSTTTSKQWLEIDAGLDDVVRKALQDEETRPRSLVIKDTLLLTLRGVNPNPEADPEDMVAMRIWTDGQRIISTRRRRLLTASHIGKQLVAGEGPANAGEFIVMVTEHLTAHIAGVIEAVDDKVDMLEEQVLTAQSYYLRGEIAGVRREAIGLRRYLSAQRDALSRLYTERIPWLSDIDRVYLREATDRTLRYIEDLDSARDRASVTHEELMSRLSEQTDRRMYVLSVVAALFLPLGFLTGLLGINVGGVPGAEDKQAFIVFVVLLVIIVLLQFILFKWKRWF